MSRGNLTGLSDESDPEVVLQLFVKEAHLSIWVSVVVLHSLLVDPPCPITKSRRHPEDLSPRPLLVLLLLFFGELLINRNLRRLSFSPFTSWRLS